MNAKGSKFILLALLLVAALVAVLYFFGGRANTAAVLLPEAVSSSAPTENSAAPTGTTLEVTPENVQSVIAALKRPESYSRTGILTRYSKDELRYDRLVSVWKTPEATRIMNMSSTTTKNTLLLGEKLYIWYDGDTVAFQASPTSQEEMRDELYQGIPTYEDLLALPAESISAAAYTQWDNWPCILAETQSAQLGYTIRYYVSTEYGLLVGYEMLDGETLLRRFSTNSLDTATPAAENFTLPDTLQGS